VLEKYVNMLGVKYIIFMGEGQFESWIPAGLFVGQLRRRVTYTYAELKHEIIGLRNEFAYPKTSASEVLKQMQEAKTDHIAIITPNKQYLYMVRKQDILAKLVSTMILTEPDQT
jgi:CBS-domain-containing membrane protein